MNLLNDFRSIYRLDGIAALLMGLALLFGAEPVSRLSGGPSSAFLLGVGLFLIPWAGFNYWMGRQAKLPRAAAWAHVALDSSWIVGSVGLVLYHASALSTWGFILLTEQALIVAGVLALKLRGVLQRSESWQPSGARSAPTA